MSAEYEPNNSKNEIYPDLAAFRRDPLAMFW
jgi:hypothetical protein